METAAGQSASSQTDETIALLMDSVNAVLDAECDSRSVHAYINGDDSIARSLWRHAADLGWLAAPLPEASGGLDLGIRGLAALQIALGRSAAPGPFLPTLCLSLWIADGGRGSVDADIVTRLSKGEWSGAVPAQFGAAPRLQLSDGKVRGTMDLLGSPDADVLVVPVIGQEGQAAWAMVSKGAGITASPRDGWDRTRSLVAVELDAPPLAVLADPDGAVGRRLQSAVAIAIAADSVGAADGIFHRTLDYLKQRVQFERPIASFQAIKHRMANHAAAVETQRHLLDQAIHSYEAGDLPELWIDLSKAGATECFVAVAGDCIQLHGGVGHTWEYDPHIYAKRAQLNRSLVQQNGAALDAAMTELLAALKAGREVTELPL